MLQSELHTQTVRSQISTPLSLGFWLGIAQTLPVATPPLSGPPPCLLAPVGLRAYTDLPANG